MNQLTNTAKKLDTLFKVFQIIATIGIVAALVALAIIGAGFLFDLDPYTIGTGYNSISFGLIDLEIAEAYAPDIHLVMGMATAETVIALVFLLVIRSCFGRVRDILNPMREGAPFHTSVSANLKQLAKNSLILCIIANVMDVATTCMYVWGFDLANLLLSDKITHVTFLTKCDLTFLIVAAVLLLLSYIFRYGEQLQQLSDETI